MSLPRDLDSLFTREDRELLATYERFAGIERKPEPMVSIEAYCSLRDANDFITRNDQIVHAQRARLLARLREQRRSVLRWRGLALILAAVAGYLAAALLRH